MKANLTIFCALLGVAVPAHAADTGGHADHAGHAMAAPAPVSEGPWSYKDRKNPAPYTKDRWEMVPVPGYGHMFVTTKGLGPGLACAALRDNPGVMVDRATRERCGMVAALPVADGHQHR